MRFPTICLVTLSVLAAACTGSDPDPVDNPSGEQEKPVFDKPEWSPVLPDDEIQVWGELIDIRTIYNSAELEVFPQNDKYKFEADAMAACGGRPQYAVSLVEKKGPEWVRAGVSAVIFVASECIDLEDPDWKYTDKSFHAGTLLYYLHQYTGPSKKAGVKIPRPEGTAHSVMVIGSKITVANAPDFGDCVITRSATPRAAAKINNVCIVMLPGGEYLVSCTGSEGDGNPRFFISRDKGGTWEPYGEYDASRSKIVNMYNLFMFRGKLYMMGLGASHKNLYLVRSDDLGKTWSAPSGKSSGLILEGTFHSAQVPVIESGGRLWRACEIYADSDKEKYPFMVSVPVDADIMNGANWTQTNVFTNTTYKVDGRSINGFTEGNAVAGPDGQVYDFLRSNNTKSSAYGTRLVCKTPGTIALADRKYCVDFPGGGKKFTLRYDEKSGKYWALTNPDTDYPADGILKHAGLTDNLSHSLMRNRLALLSSPDLVEWTVVDDAVLYHEDPFFHGFQYADWIIDGDDMAVVIRAGYPDYRGMPIRQHDADNMIFLKIKNFRNK